MSDTRDDDRWDILVERYLEGRLFPSERAALRKRLAADPALRDRLVETVVQEAALRTIPLQEGAAVMEAGAAEIVRAAAARRLMRAAAWVASAAAAVLLVVVAFVWLGRPSAPAAREIAPPCEYFEALLNPSFEEDADGDGRPDHWSNPRIRRDAERVRDGAASLRVEGPDMSGAYTGQFLRLRPGTRYRATAWLRTHGIAEGRSRGVRLRFVQLLPAPAELAVTPWRDGTRDWERVGIEFVTPADHRYGRLDIQWTLEEGEVFWADAASLGVGG